MLKKQPMLKLLAAAMVLTSILGLSAVVTGTNTATDPLVSLSYLNGTFQSNLRSEVRTAITTGQKELSDDFAGQISKLEQSLHTQNPAPAANDFQTVSLSAGQSKALPVGSEVLFLSGTATTDNAGLTDTTAGTVLVTGGQLAANHLYVAIGACTIQATGDVKFLMK